MQDAGARHAPLACWALTPQGAVLARRVAATLGAELHVPRRLAQAGEHGFARMGEAVAEHWHDAAGHVFVAATGIVVRCIASLVQSKTVDPAVVVCDQAGRYAISLLSGHLGGANRLAQDVAACCGGQAVITTATDCEGLPAFDILAAQANCAFADVAEVRAISAGLLAGQSVTVRDPLRILDYEQLKGCELCYFDESISLPDAEPRIVPRLDTDGDVGLEAEGLDVVVSLRPILQRPGRLRLHPRTLWVGVGCRRGIRSAEIVDAVGIVLGVAGFAPQSLAGFASATIKRDEAGLHAAAAHCGVNVVFFEADELAAVPVPNPSVRAAGLLGLERVGVCEAAALLAAGEGARLLVSKQIVGGSQVAGKQLGRVTVAIACACCPAEEGLV